MFKGRFVVALKSWVLKHRCRWPPVRRTMHEFLRPGRRRSSMAENRKDRDKRFYFSRGQLVLLGGAFTLASIITFLLGVFVGKRIEERRMVKQEEPLVKIPVQPLGQGTAAASNLPEKEQLTFYDTLTKSPAQSVIDEKPKETRPAERAAKPEVKEPKPKSKEES